MCAQRSWHRLFHERQLLCAVQVVQGAHRVGTVQHGPGGGMGLGFLLAKSCPTLLLCRPLVGGVKGLCFVCFRLYLVLLGIYILWNGKTYQLVDFDNGFTFLNVMSCVFDLIEQSLLPLPLSSVKTKKFKLIVRLIPLFIPS